ncbi:L-seryl-tRNA(Sec) selenium transferase [Seleniivibrio woodruffii]|uniref:L-seryl-tRNA(Sec) selenium transferase n=1 Tax=Seleniivibrio woodruffii TaxID=1078050 RepID=A0A4R1K6J9_9BACT|nr:L-seryl-tRNA(Sec) selenium transferase [Seleniivibrio woodruffii]TCK59824.1 L-seryl-tRNA(Sec) selenium transferase [Seleniivibrio woodruffii]TVZ35955.1 L-seryl-tRNA(Sec) selenium transferase [Seleniivibrio woodruffii]
MDSNLFRLLPKMDRIIGEQRFQGLPKLLLKEAAKRAVEAARAEAAAGKEPVYEDILTDTAKIYSELSGGSLKRVINATGVPIHTNLGRSPLPECAADELKSIVCGYSNLEFDTETGKRGDRYHHAAEYLKILTGAEDAVIVNNNASAVFLVLNTFAKGKEAVVSRGELVEIGGSFRVPDVMKQSGAKMVEVGTTNKTRKADYDDAVTQKTALMMKVHRSNYEIVGFSEEASLCEVAQSAAGAGCISYYDAGSGLFVQHLPDDICRDRTIADFMSSGIDLISFSGDKMAGGCQAGIIAGKKTLINKLKKNPLMRMLRVDKMTIAVLQSVFRLYLTGRENEIPVNRMLSEGIEVLGLRAAKLAALIGGKVVSTKSTVGGGSCPMTEMKSFGVEVSVKGMSSAALDRHLRRWETPVIARVGEKVCFDVRTLDERDFETILNALGALK